MNHNHKNTINDRKKCFPIKKKEEWAEEGEKIESKWGAVLDNNPEHILFQGMFPCSLTLLAA